MSAFVGTWASQQPFAPLDENVTFTELYSGVIRDNGYNFDLTQYMTSDGLYMYCATPQSYMSSGWLLILRKSGKYYPLNVQWFAGGGNNCDVIFNWNNFSTLEVRPAYYGEYTSYLYSLSDGSLADHLEYKGRQSSSGSGDNYYIYLPKDYGSGIYLILLFTKQSDGQGWINRETPSVTLMAVSSPRNYYYLMYLPISTGFNPSNISQSQYPSSPGLTQLYRGNDANFSLFSALKVSGNQSCLVYKFK